MDDRIYYELKESLDWAYLRCPHNEGDCAHLKIDARYAHDDHVRANHPKGKAKEPIPIKCRKCGCENMRRTTAIAHHLRCAYNFTEGEWQCAICEKQFTRMDRLNLHLASCHGKSVPKALGPTVRVQH